MQFTTFLWPKMFTLNFMFILVTLKNKTATLNLQVKEVLVVQAKKDTSELVKKKEEVTQVRKGGKKRYPSGLLAHQWTVKSEVLHPEKNIKTQQRPRNPRMKRSRNWRMPRSSFQRH